MTFSLVRVHSYHIMALIVLMNLITILKKSSCENNLWVHMAEKPNTAQYFNLYFYLIWKFLFCSNFYFLFNSKFQGYPKIVPWFLFKIRAYITLFFMKNKFNKFSGFLFSFFNSRYEYLMNLMKIPWCLVNIFVFILISTFAVVSLASLIGS